MLFSANIFANEIALLDQFFGKNGIKDKKALYTGEMLTYYLDKPTFGEGLPSGTKHQYRLLEKKDNQIIYTILLSKDNQSQDWYVYLIKENNVWKISAIRNLALSGIFFLGLQELENKTNRTADEEYQYQNMLLTIKSDSELKVYFKTNYEQIKKVIYIAKTDKKSANELAKTIYFHTVNFDKKTEITNIYIGGILDNSVGFMHIPDNKFIPTMSKSHYIYIEHIVGKWYIYKTT